MESATHIVHLAVYLPTHNSQLVPDTSWIYDPRTVAKQDLHTSLISGRVLSFVLLLALHE